MSVSWNLRKFHSLKYKEFFFFLGWGGGGGFFSWNIRTVFFWENIRDFFGASVSRSIGNFFELGLKSSIPWNIRRPFRVSVSWNTMIFFRGCRLSKHEKKYKKNNIRTRKFHFSKYTELFFGWIFLNFFSSLCLKVLQVAAYYTTRNYFQKHSKNI